MEIEKSLERMGKAEYPGAGFDGCRKGPPAALRDGLGRAVISGSPATCPHQSKLGAQNGRASCDRAPPSAFGIVSTELRAAKAGQQRFDRSGGLYLLPRLRNSQRERCGRQIPRGERGAPLSRP